MLSTARLGAPASSHRARILLAARAVLATRLDRGAGDEPAAGKGAGRRETTGVDPALDPDRAHMEQLDGVLGQEVVVASHEGHPLLR